MERDRSMGIGAITSLLKGRSRSRGRVDERNERLGASARADAKLAHEIHDDDGDTPVALAVDE